MPRNSVGGGQMGGNGWAETYEKASVRKTEERQCESR